MRNYERVWKRWISWIDEGKEHVVEMEKKIRLKGIGEINSFAKSKWECTIDEQVLAKTEQSELGTSGSFYELGKRSE